MSSPTSTPKPATPLNQKKLKLRASCDSCAASKVKCSKDHPICARCFANNTQCVYGVSRKHGKPGRSRKRNPDGTQFIKFSKQRLSPDRTDFSKYTLQSEHSLPQTDLEMGTNWASDWSTTTPSLPATPDFGIEATPEPFYTNLDSSEIGFMDPAFLSTAQVKPKTTQIAQPDLVLGDQFAKTPLEQLCSPEPQARDAYMDTKDLKPLRYTYNDTMSTAHPHSFSSSSTIHTPMSQSMGSYDPPQFLADSSKPTPHCCYTLAYSTFQSISMLGTDTYPVLNQEALTSDLSTARLAIDSVLQLVRCPCSSNPHLAMLYSSITSKILTWCRIAGGVDGAIPLNSSVTSTSQQMDSVYHVPFSQPEFPSSLIGAGSNEGTNYALQDMHAQRHRFDELERQRHRRQMVLYELRNCEKLVEALVEWRGNGRSCEQAKYLYGMLGAWLERELHKTVEEIKGVEIPHIRAG
ncbi:Fungal transcriptional regulatory protein [Pyrenophora tritici-repentis]|uniref:Fungal transcriptional regulatory protein n=1 Tax=Pyrenophora tritici-repentis TaxID=45151 RepID=A0A2W1HNI8_9PLEO|nr:Fusarubin cluster-transcription factor [Pyrenophora tritici-repentis]KAF7446873.1 Fusarubin cluster-transcription factor [Pyrenophora tritici-repentis]KAF7569148.1 Fungal transcriptional regulatory protein [Pyrenophora tritici-repentis]KAG9383051.1 Fusarubin cluster-transcription factor [Pyrenophora tritici-repentis]KAI0588567.1 Fusarubin cluster-transcription factor [Pyrenophora tritici-repentis]